MSIFDEINQLDIFDILNEKEAKKGFEENDLVVIRFYTDELEYARTKMLHLMGIGTIIGKKNDFFLVAFEGQTEYIEEKRLKHYSS